MGESRASDAHGGADADRPVGGTVGAVVEAVVERAAPEEATLVEQYRSEDHAFVVRRLKKRHHDELLGFGLPDAAVYLAPVLYIALDQALRKVVDIGVEGAVKRLGRRLLGRRTHRPDEVPPLSAEQIRRVRAEVERTMTDDGLSADRSREAGAVLEDLLLRHAGLAGRSANANDPDDDPDDHREG